MLINFISLFDAMGAVFPRIAVLDEEVDHYSGVNRTEDPYNFQRTPIHQYFQKARAANLLAHCIFNASPSLTWFDTSLTGSPLQSNEACEEGRIELVNTANQELRFKDAFSNASRTPLKYRAKDAGKLHQMPPLHSDLTVARIFHIGFDRTELVNLLDGNEISHNLVSPTSSKTPLALGATVSSKPKEITNVKFKGPMAEVLRMACQTARDPNDYQTAWEELLKMARLPDGERPFPLYRVTSVTEIMYHDLDCGEDAYKFYQKSNLKKSFKHSESKKLKNS